MPPAKGRSSRCGLSIEHDLARAGYLKIAGVDEVGRGALFGPVVASAVMLREKVHPGIDDSKRLTPVQRHRIAVWIMKNAKFAVASARHDEIDRLNIRCATFEAMRRAISLLDPQPDYVLVDGESIPGLAIPQRGLIKGDQLSASIAAASIVAKVQRDQLINMFAPKFPCYNLSKNKGYGTVAHMEAIRRFGVSELHRRSFCHSLDGVQGELFPELASDGRSDA